jgi:uncharacterized protein YjbJ (UPF0337 family)
MSDQHVKGAANRAKGSVEEAVGRLTGNKKLEAEGKLAKVQGKTQNVLGDVDDAVTRARSD